MARFSRRTLFRGAAVAGMTAVAAVAVPNSDADELSDLRSKLEAAEQDLETSGQSLSASDALRAATAARSSALQVQLRVTDEARFRELVRAQEIDYQLDIGALETERTRREIADLESEFEFIRRSVGSRIRAIYKASRSTSPLTLILSSDSLTEGLDKVAALEQVLRQDQDEIKRLLAKREEIRLRYDLLKDQQDNLGQLREQKAEVQEALDRRWEEHLQRVEEVKRQQAGYESDVRAFAAEQSALGGQIDYLKQQIEDELARIERERRIAEARRLAAGLSGGAYFPPLYGIVTTEYGGCTYGQCPHLGIDIAAPLTTPIVAASSGVVIKAGYAIAGNRWASYGMTVIIAHGPHEETLYAHLADTSHPPTVKQGDTVIVGDTIGYVGVTGWTTGPHLHFELRRNGAPVNPRDSIQFGF